MDLDFRVLSQELHPLSTAFPNLIKREWPQKISADNGLQLLLNAISAVTANTYRTILWIVAEKPESTGRKLEYVLAVPPLIRSILDQVMTVCFLSEDPQARARWYHKVSWMDIQARHTRELERFSDHPHWKGRLASDTELLAVLAGLAQLSDAEKADPSKHIKFWPNPGKMKGRATTQPVKDFLQFVEDWFYQELSQETHLKGAGLISLAPPLIQGVDQEGIRENLELQRSQVVLTTVTLMVALLSEIQGILQFPNMSPKLTYLWGIMADLWRDPKELYERRYQGLLALPAER